MAKQTQAPVRATYDAASHNIRISSGSRTIGNIPAIHVQSLAETSETPVDSFHEFTAGPLTTALQNTYDGVDVEEIVRENPTKSTISIRDYKKGGEFVTVPVRDHFAQISRALAFKMHNEDALAQAFEIVATGTKQEKRNGRAHTFVDGPGALSFD